MYYFTDKLNLKNNKNIALANLNIYFTWKNVTLEYNNNQFKIHEPTWNESFVASDESYSVPDLPDYFEYIIKKQKTITEENSPIKIYANKIKKQDCL